MTIDEREFGAFCKSVLPPQLKAATHFAIDDLNFNMNSSYEHISKHLKENVSYVVAYVKSAGSNISELLFKIINDNEFVTENTEIILVVCTKFDRSDDHKLEIIKNMINNSHSKATINLFKTDIVIDEFVLAGDNICECRRKLVSEYLYPEWQYVYMLNDEVSAEEHKRTILSIIKDNNSSNYLYTKERDSKFWSIGLIEVDGYETFVAEHHIGQKLHPVCETNRTFTRDEAVALANLLNKQVKETIMNFGNTKNKKNNNKKKL